jgi:Subtilase family
MAAPAAAGDALEENAVSPDIDRASKNWYIAPAPARAANWPEKLLLDSYELDPSDMTWGATDGGAPTIYRRSFLTAPASADARSPGVSAEFSAALAHLGWSVVAAEPSGDDAQTAWLRIDGDLTHQVDAWQALQTLRSANTLSARAADVAGSLSLARVSFIGMPAKEGHAGAAREAVEVLAAAPPWRPAGQVPGRRHPVVALLDTGVDAHGWLGAGNQATNGDRFCVDAQDLGFVPAGPALPARGAGDTSPHDGQLDTHAGHGTFIAGLIRQVAPDAQVLSLHAMHGDGVLDEETVNSALQWLLERVRRAGDAPELFVDVICLAFGYYEQQPSDNRSTAHLRQLLGELGDLGVRVVASAGNHGSDAQVLPAAFADQRYQDAGTAPATQLISVGALNPDGSRAAYSNFGDWVRAWEVGTALMSTIPIFGTEQDASVVAEFDPANLVDGFARWGGTSFAAAAFAARLAQALVDDAEPDGTRLRDVSAPAAQLRAARALATVSRS